jgi:hypothetical protein
MIAETVPLYRVFESTVHNDTVFENPFVDVNLEVSYTAPSGRTVDLFGFYDGDGRGGKSGNVWKLRFCPTEIGLWRYRYFWSDGTPGGEGTFECISDGAGKGVLQPYGQNPHWIAYNGVDPVFLRSYYVGGTLVCPVNWAKEKVYEPLIARGYNHVMFNQMLPVEWVHTDAWLDAPSVLAKYLFEDNDPTERMNLDVWNNMEEHIRWLNERDVGVYVFQGFDGKHIHKHVCWEKLSKGQKDFYVRYVCARLAPFANIAGWTYTWETEGDGPELELMELLAKYDPWNHLRTYEAERPKQNHFDHPLYTWAAVENHELGDTHGAESHHLATLAGYAGKPVIMLEGNGLWKAFWNADENTIRRAAWAVVTAGGSFTWDWIIPNGSEPASSHQMLDTDAVTYMDILYRVITEDLDFSHMEPHDELISAPARNAYCLAELGKQYLVWKQDGGEVDLLLPKGIWQGVWVDTKTNERLGVIEEASANGFIKFNSPDESSDWALVLKRL